jgi:hypothetical protein
MTLDELLAVAKTLPVTEEMKRAAAISFAYGNCRLDGCQVTREGIEKAYDELHPEEARHE